jgi:hypothetical protein
MRTLKTSFLLLVVFLLMAPAPAQAWWGWLDELSGPGPWMFFDVQYRIACIEDRGSDAAAMAATEKNQRANVLRSLKSFDGFARVAAAVSGVGCLLQPEVRPRASVNFSTGAFVAVANNPRPPGAGRLLMQKYEFSASTFLDDAKIFQANAGGGVFKGLGDSDFSRGYWTVSATMTPYAAVARDSGTKSLLRTITVNVGVVVVPNGFAAKDFGATGPFHSDHEVLKTISLTLDFSRY